MVVQIVQGTNPTLTFTLPFETSLLSSIEVTFSEKGGRVLLAKTSAVYSGYEARVQLSQDETFNFIPGFYNIQLRIKRSGTNKIFATPFIVFEVLPLASKVQI